MTTTTPKRFTTLTTEELETELEGARVKASTSSRAREELMTGPRRSGEYEKQLVAEIEAREPGAGTPGTGGVSLVVAATALEQLEELFAEARGIGLDGSIPSAFVRGS